MFMGQYDYAVDAKGRLNFPAKFRDGMGETFIVTRWLDHCLAAFPPEEFEKVAQRIAEKGMVKGRNVSRMLYSSAVEVTPDKQGRIQLPAKLREYANLDHDVSVIGRSGTPRIGKPARRKAMKILPPQCKTLIFKIHFERGCTPAC